MKLATLPGTALLAALAPPASAQESVLAVRPDGGAFDLYTVELDAGVVVDSEAVALQPLTPFPIQTLFSLARVGDEVWLGGADGVLRYGGTPLAYRGRFAQGLGMGRIVPSAAGAFVQYYPFGAVGPLEEVDATGATIRTIAAPAEMLDIDPYQGGYLAIFGDRIYRTDLDLVILGEFAPGLAAEVAQASGFGFDPRRLAVLSDGRIAITSLTYLVITDPSGALERVDQAGNFESDVFETSSGALFVATGWGARLMDPDGGRSFEVTTLISNATAYALSPPFVSQTAPVSTRHCVAEVNSTGVGGRVHVGGETSADERRLKVIATDLPPASFTIPIHGTASYNAPFGDGRLCVSPFSPGLTRGPVSRTLPTGDVEQEYDFVTPGLGATFVAGSTWYFQVIYRDTGAAGFNATDGVSITFAP